MVHAAAALQKAGVRLQGDLWLTGVVGHETPIGKKEGPLRLVEQLNAGELQADAILIVEGPAAVWAASLGSTVFTVTITSDRGAIHTVKVPYSENPACWMGHLLTRFAEWEREFESRPEHPLCGRERVNVGIVRGGDYMNRLPTPLIVSGQRRWLPGQTAAGVLGEFEALCHELAARSGLRFSVLLEGTREPFETPRDHPLVTSLRAAGETCTGTAPEVIGMALVGDANLYANGTGISTAYYGPAHETAHSDHERVSMHRLADCARIYALAAAQYCGVA
ncbi:MAG: M20/M25/M40 family metallo-hydrolase, partial [Armatimonadetes bacterium]|nr:M20/M25/M40 family metallo-hydrolase [Armatimonadota bacterium]